MFSNLVLCHNDLAIAEHELWGSMNGDTLVDISNSVFWFLQIKISQRCYKKYFASIGIQNITFQHIEVSAMLTVLLWHLHGIVIIGMLPSHLWMMNDKNREEYKYDDWRVTIISLNDERQNQRRGKEYRWWENLPCEHLQDSTRRYQHHCPVNSTRMFIWFLAISHLIIMIIYHPLFSEVLPW